MVNKKEHNPNQDDIEITNESSEIMEPELEDIENTSNQKIKKGSISVKYRITLDLWRTSPTV